MVNFRGYQSGDDKNIVSLLKEVFNGWPKQDLQCSPLDHWTWKFIDNPTGIKFIALALDGDSIIGCFHILPQKIKLGENFYLVGNEVDVGIHPAFRGQGIYNKFLPLREQFTHELDIKLTYGIGSNPILIKHVKKAGERQYFPFKFQKMVKIRDINLHLDSYPGGEKERYGYHLLKTMNRFKFNKDSENFSPEFKISQITQFDERINTFWNTIKDSYEFIIVRDKNYLNWRYCDPRGGNYIIKLAEAENRILGFSVLRLSKSNQKYPIGYIVDLLALPNHLNVINKLTSDAIEYFYNNDVNCIMASALKNSSYESSLYKADFINNVSNQSFITYRSYFDKNQIDILKKYKVDKMYYSYGDYDVV